MYFRYNFIDFWKLFTKRQTEINYNDVAINNRGGLNGKTQ